MKKVSLIVVCLSFLTICSAMQLTSDPCSVSCPIDIYIQLPIPKNTSLTESVMTDTQIIDYLKTQDLDINSIPFGMYISIQNLAEKTPLNEEFADALLRVWGINPSILEEKDKIVPALIKGICDALNQVKENLMKKIGESS